VAREISLFLESAAVDLAKQPASIFEALLAEFSRRYPAAVVKLPTKKQVASTIRELRSPSGRNISIIETPAEMETADGTPFLRRHWFGEVHGVYERLALWTSSTGLSVLRGEGHIFLDGTFRAAPPPFKQCVIIVAFDAATNLFIPCVWALLTSKSEYLYCCLLHELIVLLEYRWMPKLCTVDFEKGLINAVQHEFSQSKMVGCFFHFKQALFKRMRRMGLPKKEIAKCCELINILTIIPHDQLSLAIKFIRRHDVLRHNEWKGFWKYFDRTWTRRYPISLWNIHDQSDYELSGRTNNAVERYNRRLGDQFPNAHPTLGFFLQVIRKEEAYFSHLTEAIRKGSVKISTQIRDFERPKLPSNYLDFIKYLK
jgi:hypothetical protein